MKDGGGPRVSARKEKKRIGRREHKAQTIEGIPEEAREGKGAGCSARIYYYIVDNASAAMRAPLGYRKTLLCRRCQRKGSFGIFTAAAASPSFRGHSVSL